MRECCVASPRSCPSTYPGTVRWPPRRWPPGPTGRGGRPPPLASRDGPQRRADGPARTRRVRPGAAADVPAVLAARHRPGGNRRGRRHTQVGVDHDRPQDASIRAGIRGVPRGARRAGAQLLHRRAPHRDRRRAHVLPQLRGSAPINWALIRGERQTGNSLIWLAQDVDRGAIIDQTAFCITPYDTCASLYERVAASNRDMLLRLVPRLLAGEHPGRVQPAGDEPVLPRRRPADGRIDWRQPSRAVYDFIRALTRPYPGAFSWLEGERWTIWHAAHLPAENGPGLRATPGAVLGPVVSPVEATCGQMVACGAGAVVLLELQADDGTVLRGRELSDQPWTGKRWNHEDPQPESSAQ